MSGTTQPAYDALTANRPARIQRIIDALDRFNDACATGPVYLAANLPYCTGQLNRVLAEVSALNTELRDAAREVSKAATGGG